MTHLSRRAPGIQRKRGSHILVMAKAPVPGKVKTRLCPPLTPKQAADVAEAALADTLDSVARCHAERKILALDGSPGEWLPTGFEVIAQRGATFDERLAAAWGDAAGPGLQIGMDTPQITSELLDQCLELTFQRGTTASLGRATDGGWWAIGLSDGWSIDVFTGIPMSTPSTAAIQLMRLREAGHRVVHLPWLTDVDNIEDALLVAGQATGPRFPAVTRGLRGHLGGVA
jgi:glycosyltransferase A (GT-A) superfamily protein (DUF2064 family)